MNRYKINTDGIANQTTPWILKSKRMILIIQSLLYPIQKMGDRFNIWANEKAIEASVTSQTGYFEWFLNRKFKMYFEADGRISLLNTINVGTPVFNEDEKGKSILYTADGNLKDAHPVYRVYENTGDLAYSFLVLVPKVSKIPQEEFNDMVAYWVDKYKVVGKTYKIKVEK